MPTGPRPPTLTWLLLPAWAELLALEPIGRTFSRRFGRSAASRIDGEVPVTQNKHLTKTRWPTNLYFFWGAGIHEAGSEERDGKREMEERGATNQMLNTCHWSQRGGVGFWSGHSNEANVAAILLLYPGLYMLFLIYTKMHSLDQGWESFICFPYFNNTWFLNYTFFVTSATLFVI